jgi:hypothetical protein
MARLRQDLWLSARGRDLPFLALCAAVVATMFRSVDVPSFEVGVAGTSVSLGLTDVVLAVLAGFVLARLAGRGALPRPARAVTAAAFAFSAWLLLSSAVNGVEALVGAGKLLEYGILGLGAVLFVPRRAQVWALVALLVAITAVVDVIALVDVAQSGERQGAFIGSHELAWLGGMVLAAGVALLFASARRLHWVGIAVTLVGATGTAVGAALAGLLGMWLALAAIVALAVARGSLRLRPLLLTLAVGAAVTAAAIPLRSGDLGFIEEGPSLGAKSAGGWSQRLIYTYIGGRVFLDNPILGTGWHGNLPPSEWAHFLDDAKRRFPEQPPRYFPAPTDEYVPQQTYDQVLTELGIVGAALFLVLAGLVVGAAVGVGRRWPRGGPDEALAYLPTAWIAALAGSLAGAALYGGLALTALFWLTLGVVALMPSLVPPRRPEPRSPAQREERTPAPA